MNLVLDGVSGVGKSYLAKVLAKKFDLEFVDFVVDKPEYDPNDPDMEVILYNEVIANHYLNHRVLENSLQQALMVKTYMAETSKISLGTLSKIIDSYVAHRDKVTPYILIQVTDSPEEIQMRRRIRNRKWEYFPDATDEYLTELDRYIEWGKPSQPSSVLGVIKHNRSKYNNINEEIEHLIKKIRLVLRNV